MHPTKPAITVTDPDFQTGRDLLPLVYDELRRLAAWRLAREAPGQTLQATALVHEAWLRIEAGDRRWRGKGHFFAAIGEVMRRILIDHARRRRAVRHGGGLTRAEGGLDELAAADTGPGGTDEALAVHEALDRLEALDARKAALVKLRYFSGLTLAEAARALGVAEPTAKRDWAYARAWLFRKIRRGQGEG